MGISRSVKQLSRAFKLIHGLQTVFGFIDSFLIYFQVKFKKKVVSVIFHRQKIHFRKNTKDKETFLEIFQDQIYNTPYSFEPKNIVDAGANVGYVTLFFKMKHPDCSIVAVEIDQGNIECIKKNTANLSNVEIINKGMYDTKAFFKIEDPYNATNSFQVREVSKGEDFTIESVTVPEILTLKNWDTIDILKIDIEGAEKKLFSSHYEQWLPKVKILFIETHDRMTKGCSQQVTTTMNKFGQFVLYTTTTGTLVYYNTDLMQIP